MGSAVSIQFTDGVQTEEEARRKFWEYRRASAEVMVLIDRLSDFGWIPKTDRKTRARNRHNFRMETDAHYKLGFTLRGRVLSALKSQAAQKSDRTFRLVGCSIKFLRSHLESKFRDGMSWENHGEVWEIDHARPCASFDLRKPADQRACFHWSNLQPLTCEENRRKGAKWTPPKI